MKTEVKPQKTAVKEESFWPVQTVTFDVIERVPATTEVARRYIELRQGSALDVLTNGLYWTDKASTPEEALSQLYKMIDEIIPSISKVDIYSSNFKGGRPSNAIRRMKKAVYKKDRGLNQHSFCRLNGSFGHAAFFRYFLGKSKEVTGNTRQLSMDEFLADQEIWSGNRLSDKHLQRIEDVTESITTSVNGFNWQDVYPSLHPELSELRRLMRPVAGREIDALENHSEKLPGSLAIVQHSIKCWADGLLGLEKSNQSMDLIVNEALLTPRKYGVHLGRVDAIDYKTSDLEPKTFKTVQEFLRTIKDSGIHSNGRIIDLKFAHGDGVKGEDEIRLQQINSSPQRKDISQMEGYLSWMDAEIIPEATIIYIVDGGVVFHTVTASEESKERHHRQLAKRWDKAQEYAFFNEIDNRLVNRLFLLRKAMFTSVFPQCLVKSEISDQPKFRWQMERDNPIVNVFHKHKELMAQETIKVKNEKKTKEIVYVDENHIFIDTKNRNKNKRYVLDKVRLEEVLAEGEIVIYGSKLPCPFHDDKNKPNLHIYEDNGTFHCFACQAHGIIDFGPNHKPDSQISHRSRIKILYNREKKPKVSEIDQQKIDTQHEVLLRAVEIAQKEFSGSKAEKYVRDERKIDLDFARQFKLGYGHDLAIQVVRSGIDYDEAIKAGLINISPYQQYSSLINRLAKDLSINPENLKRPAKIKGQNAEIMGVPYDPWEGRVISPLYLFGDKITSLHGRVVPPHSSKITHLKPSIKKSGVPQGAFNLDKIYTTKSSTIALFEGVFDALTLAYLKALFPDVWGKYEPIAIIGTGNSYVLKEIAFSGKKLAVALDNDEIGIKRTTDIFKTLSYFGIDQKEIEDLREYMIRIYPTMLNYDDQNSWWKEEGYKQFGIKL